MNQDMNQFKHRSEFQSIQVTTLASYIYTYILYTKYTPKNCKNFGWFLRDCDQNFLTLSNLIKTITANIVTISIFGIPI